MKFEWLQLNKIDVELATEITRRAKTHGGWLVDKITVVNGVPMQTMVFISDQNHEWTIDE